GPVHTSTPVAQGQGQPRRGGGVLCRRLDPGGAGRTTGDGVGEQLQRGQDTGAGDHVGPSVLQVCSRSCRQCGGEGGQMLLGMLQGCGSPTCPGRVAHQVGQDTSGDDQVFG